MLNFIRAIGISDMKNIGYVYMDRAGNVCFQIGDFHIEYIASKILTKINGVIEYDNTGYVVLDTNYGEDAQFASTDCPFRMSGADSSVETV